MKVSILISEGVKQIIFTPTSDHEREVLSHIDPEDQIHTVVKKGEFVGSEDHVLGYEIFETRGGYYRAEEHRESLMFVVTPKEKK